MHVPFFNLKCQFLVNAELLRHRVPTHCVFILVEPLFTMCKSIKEILVVVSVPENIMRLDAAASDAPLDVVVAIANVHLDIAQLGGTNLLVANARAGAYLVSAARRVSFEEASPRRV